MSKADHMLSILWLLKTRRKMTAAAIADELEIHVRSVYRYIDALCASGVPILSDTGRSGGYHIADRFADAPLFFDEEEQKALIHAALFAREAGYPHVDALARAVNKIKRYTNPGQLDRLTRHESGIQVIQPPAPPGESGLLQLLESAVAAGCSLSVIYQTGYEGLPQSRRIDPYGLVHWKSKWYLAGFCHLRQEIRNFRIDRIMSLTETNVVFERPEGFSARDFLLESLLPGSGEDSWLSVHVTGNAEAIHELSRHWLISRTQTQPSAQELHFEIDEWNLYTQVPYLLLAYGGRIRVEEPPELKDCMAEIAFALYETYRSPEET